MTLATPEPPKFRTASDGARADVPLFLANLPPPARRFSLAAWERRGALTAFVLVVAGIAVAVAMVLPKWYAAESTILPPTEGGEALGLMSALIENKTLNRLGLFSSTTPSDVYAEILKSRTIREPLVRTFDLPARYRTPGMDRTLKVLDQHVRVSVTPVGVVTVRVEDRDPQRAADMANQMIESLDRFNRESVVTRAKQTRLFLEQRLVDVASNLQRAESTLTAYERRHKVVASTEGPAVGAMAGVITQKLNLEVRRSYMSSYTRPGSTALREVDAEIAAVNREIAKLPGLKQEGARLSLDGEIQRRLFTLLTTQYEEMRMREAQDTPTLTVLDEARAPEMRSRPRRAVIVLASTIAAALLGLAWVGLTMRGPVRA